MRGVSSRVVEEFDNVMVKCAITEPKFVTFDRNLTFSVGYGNESSIPKFIDDGVIGLSPGSTKEITISINSLTADEKQFLCLEKTKDSFATFILKLLQLQKLKEVWEMTEKEKISSARQCKCRGNSHLQEGKYPRALRAYKLGIQCLEGSVSVKPAKDVSISRIDPDAQQIYSNLLTNAALCLLKIASHPEKPATISTGKPVSTEKLMRHCINLCEKALELDQNNAKALYRMAQAHAQTKSYEYASLIGQKAIAVLKSKGLNPAAVEISISTWEEARRAAKREEYEHVHSAFLTRAIELRKQGRLFADDENGDANRLHFDDWSNDLAKDVMSIQEELEAFGETMPERKPVSLQSKLFPKGSKKGKHRSVSKLEAIESGDEGEEGEEEFME